MTPPHTDRPPPLLVPRSVGAARSTFATGPTARFDSAHWSAIAHAAGSCGGCAQIRSLQRSIAGLEECLNTAGNNALGQTLDAQLAKTELARLRTRHDMLLYGDEAVTHAGTWPAFHQLRRAGAHTACSRWQLVTRERMTTTRGARAAASPVRITRPHACCARG